MDVYRHHAAAFAAEWALVLLLRSFAKHDQAAADYAARDIWNGWEAGDALHEWTYEWAREYGLPEVKNDELEAPSGQDMTPEAHPGLNPTPANAENHLP